MSEITRGAGAASAASGLFTQPTQTPSSRMKTFGFRPTREMALLAVTRFFAFGTDRPDARICCAARLEPCSGAGFARVIGCLADAHVHLTPYAMELVVHCRTQITASHFRLREPVSGRDRMFTKFQSG